MPFAGEQIAVNDILAGDKSLGDAADALIAGTDLKDNDLDGLKEHSKESESMWASDDPVDSLTFQLESSQELETVFVYNYNHPYLTGSGIKTADVQVWQDGSWKTVKKGFELEPAQGSEDYDMPSVIELEPVKTDKVRFANLITFNDAAPIGLSEVAFYKVRGPEAILISPEDDAKLRVSDSITLSWAPGRNAQQHEIHIGDSPDTLESMGTLETESAIVNGLERGKKYYWRVDSIDEQDNAHASRIRSFQLAGDIVGHWVFDGLEDGFAPDAVGERDAELSGNASIAPDAGKYWSALKLDGKSSAKILPLNLESDGVTITGWIKATEKPSGVTGLMMTRDAGTVAGINLLGSELRYHWDQGNWDWGSGLDIPTGQWTFVALVVQPQQATLYMHDGNEMQSSVHMGPHSAEEFYGDFGLGLDPGRNDRYFTGLMDDVRVYDYSLKPNEVESVCKNESMPSTGELAVVGVERSKLEPMSEQAGDTGEQSADDKNNMLPVLTIVGIIAGIGIFSAFVKRGKSD
ncbi:hypothetical protein STSP2_01358 [Anaerohalosphaera lusitana]|uniref:LamG-like jellyroll fold domain-containing protein n=1 Tax=Anaerohalosphaera lusitana TaxID=1936003 RepID=A0A1U9NJT6_9BACT|nr:LamG-like jellyroll fold domain-containing protein [Anaerohalosphaera lusitana]AQT68203.1 hypothetical protein STSP2_01358 [Anaerohalosphaera lusitana]